MKAWKIISFKQKLKNLYLTRKGEDINIYEGTTPEGLKVTLNGMEFICNGNYIVHSIKRNKVGNIPEGLFTIGDDITFDGTVSKIATFKLIDSDVAQIILSNGKLVNLYEATKYVPKPAAEPAAAVGGPVFFKDIETKILKETKPLRLRATKKDRKDQTVQNFLIRFFEDYNKERETIFVADETVQTDTNGGEGRRRSLGDIFTIVRYYYPHVTLKEVMKHLYITLPAHFGPEAGFRTCACKQINKRVWYLDSTKGKTEALDLKKEDEYGYIYDTVKAKL